jgi:hypothetical protein
MRSRQPELRLQSLPAFPGGHASAQVQEEFHLTSSADIAFQYSRQLHSSDPPFP